jgi:hypothetical protein
MVLIRGLESIGNNCGTGFYIDIPHAKYRGVDVYVILTAGHNLISQDGTRSADLRVVSKEPAKTSKESDKVSKELDKGWLVPDENVRICPAYTEEPNEDGSASDWGVIFQPKTRAEKREMKWKGFQFNLAFAANPPRGDREDTLEKFMAPRISVTGYRVKPAGEPSLSAGKGWPSGLKRLSYRAITEQGMSGSPVWGVCDDELTVVGIQ